MTRQQLRVVLQGFEFCCDYSNLALGALLDLLAAHECLDSRDVKLALLIPDEGVRSLMLYVLDRAGLVEHGESILHSWLTARGADVLQALRREQPDGFDKLSRQHCMHGYDLDEWCERCELSGQALGLSNGRIYTRPKPITELGWSAK